MVLIVLGVGTVLYNLGVLVESVTEGHLRQYLWRSRMDRDISHLRDHVIVCGHGRVGRSAARQLVDTGHDVVVVDSDSDASSQGLTVPHVLGDASRDDTLREAGIDRARALICALGTDAETMYATLSARALRPELVIISRARTLDSKEKLVLAGATRAVNPQLIGGRRMASFALYADVAEFLDEVMHEDDLDFRIEQVRRRRGQPARRAQRGRRRRPARSPAASCSPCAGRARGRSCRTRPPRPRSTRARRSSSSAARSRWPRCAPSAVG